MKTSFQYKKLKKGNIAKMLKSKISRDDIPCETIECKTCDRKRDILSLSQTIIILDSSLILEQIDAIENFEVINNCILPQSEYVYLSNLNDKVNVFNRLNTMIENRNIYLFPNEFHKEIYVENEETIKKQERKTLIFGKTIEFFLNHYSAISNDFKIVVITNNEKEEVYKNYFNNNSNNNSSRFQQNLQILTLSKYAHLEMKEFPDLYNYIAHFEKVSNQENVIMQDSQFDHLEEAEMKSLIKQGQLFQGKIIFQPNILNSAICRAYIFEKEIYINNLANLNRAMHGDIVCFQVLDESGKI